MCAQHASVTTEDGLYCEPPVIDWDTVVFPSGKLWIYNFIGGSWNSEVAKSKKEAIKQAKLRWKIVCTASALTIDKTTFHVASTKEHRLLCID